MDLAPNTTQQPAKFHLLHVPFSKTYLACAQQTFITGQVYFFFQLGKLANRSLSNLRHLKKKKVP
uniref:Uncharacterized protein n=1 Tax=Anguilla anguilla TaxID=7936 RepID=A0A0E9SRQ0_ANGAN